MNIAPLPARVPVAVARTFVHYPTATTPEEARPAVMRSRSAPADVSDACWKKQDRFEWTKDQNRVAVFSPGRPGSDQAERDQVLPQHPVFDGMKKTPQKPTRILLAELSVEELGSVARTYGLGKLLSREDQKAAARILPITPALDPDSLRRVRRVEAFLHGLSWDQLIHLLRDLATKQMGLTHNNAGAEYFQWVCNILLTSQLRDAALCGPTLGDLDSVTAWRMSRICATHGLGSWWGAVQSRLGGGEMVFLTCQRVPLLCDELAQVRRLVAHCQVASVRETKCELNRLLESCEVLYIAGKHDKTISRLKELDALDITLTVLNTCCSEKLARHLMTKGVRQVVYWPTFVHDSEAVNFGVALVRNLFEHRIEDAFLKAKQVVSDSERAPRLLCSKQPVREQLRVADVILGKQRSSRSHSPPGRGTSKRSHDKPGYAGKCAQVLPHTALNGWVKVKVGDVIVPWRVGHWREVAPAMQTAQSEALADTQPDTEEDDEGEAMDQGGDETEDTQYFLRCMESTRHCRDWRPHPHDADLRAKELPVSPPLCRKRAADEETTAVTAIAHAEALHQGSPCEATQVDDCADTLLDIESPEPLEIDISKRRKQSNS